MKLPKWVIALVALIAVAVPVTCISCKPHPVTGEEVVDWAFVGQELELAGQDLDGLTNVYAALVATEEDPEKKKKGEETVKTLRAVAEALEEAGKIAASIDEGAGTVEAVLEGVDAASKLAEKLSGEDFDPKLQLGIEAAKTVIRRVARYAERADAGGGDEPAGNPPAEGPDETGG